MRAVRILVVRILHHALRIGIAARGIQHHEHRTAHIQAGEEGCGGQQLEGRNFHIVDHAFRNIDDPVLAHVQRYTCIVAGIRHDRVARTEERHGGIVVDERHLPLGVKERVAHLALVSTTDVDAGHALVGTAIFRGPLLWT